MRGDPPALSTLGSWIIRSTPHARGSTLGQQLDLDTVGVYPACAGIHLPRALSPAIITRLPRMRGDPPHGKTMFILEQKSTPHARGSTPITLWSTTSPPVYPACAGIHPPRSAARVRS